ncbi:MAG TPA: hypothetical protein VEJ84_14020 [Acidimicrobiales bacterium]|nr:hypothetical protein [Acidimicrobiales bacterium]
MYLMREVFRAQRGKAPEVVDALRVIDQVFQQAGFTNGRLFVDYDGDMDTVVYQCELESLDQFYTLERGLYVNPDAATRALVDAFNANTTSGQRELYEVIQ